MNMNYYKLVASFIFIIFFITGCAQPGKKVKGFKHDTPLISGVSCLNPLTFLPG